MTSAVENVARARRWLVDQVLRAIQQHCAHPDEMVASDILEGRADVGVAYCRRCGAIRLNWRGVRGCEWRLPDPNLWRGR